MHDQVGMCMTDCFAHLAEQIDARGQVQLARLAVSGDWFAIDIFEGEVGLAIAVDAGVQQSRDIGMGEAGQDLALAVETLAQAGVHQARPQQLQGDLALV